MADDKDVMDVRELARQRLRARRAEAAEAAEAEASGPAGPVGPLVREYVPRGGRPEVSARRAAVLFYRNGGYSVVTLAGAQHMGRRALARPYTACEIALGTYETMLRMDLPASGGTTFFKAEVDIHWTVTDPHLVAVQGVTDIAEQFTAPVLERLREVTSDYPLARAEQANKAITRECSGGRWADLGTELGLRVRLYVRLGMDEWTLGHIDGIRKANASVEVTRVHQDLFRDMLRGGELEQLAYMLAAQPEAAKDFLEQIRQEGRSDEKDRVDRLLALVASDKIHNNDVEMQVLNRLSGGRHLPIEGSVGAGAARRSAPELEPSPAEPFTPDWVSDDPPSRTRHQPSQEPEQGAGQELPRRRAASRDDDWDWAVEGQ